MRARLPQTSPGPIGARLGLAAALAALLFSACGSDAQGVGSCKQIEEARCRQAPSCPMIPSTPPYFTSGSSVDACIQYYDVACLHGLEVADPGPTVVQACIHAIQTKGCDVVATPQGDPACAWLVPPAGSPDASDSSVETSADAGEGGEAGSE